MAQCPRRHCSRKLYWSSPPSWVSRSRSDTTPVAGPSTARPADPPRQGAPTPASARSYTVDRRNALAGTGIGLGRSVSLERARGDEHAWEADTAQCQPDAAYRRVCGAVGGGASAAVQAASHSARADGLHPIVEASRQVTTSVDPNRLFVNPQTTVDPTNGLPSPSETRAVADASSTRRTTAV